MDIPAGILLGVALVLAWAVMFLPLCRDVKAGLRLIAVTLIFLFVYFTLPYLLAAGYPVRSGMSPFSAFIAAVIVLIPYEIFLLLIGDKPPEFLPVISAFFLLITIGMPSQLHEISTAMWLAPDPGSVRNGEACDLAGIHAVAILFALIMSVMLWIAFARKKSRAVLLAMSVSAFVSTVLSGLAFYQTIPQSGDEGTLMWLFLVPAAIGIAILMLTTCLLVPLIGLLRGKQPVTPPIWN